MAGHSKWANIKRKKEIKDTKKAKLFTKATREILVAIQGNPNPQTNSRLRIAIQNAKCISLPKENIERLLKKANNKESTTYTKASYEGYGPHGIGFLVETMTDNINRTVAYLRTTFNKNGGNLDKRGAISHLFDYKGLFIIEKPPIPHWENITLELIEAGIDNIEEEEYLYITCPPGGFQQIQNILENKNIPLKEAGLKYIPTITTKLDAIQTEQIYKLIDELEDLDDVQYVYHNLDIESN